MTTLHVARWVLPICGEPIPDGGVVVEGDRVVAVGPAAELSADAIVEHDTAAGQTVLLPGLVNAHAHLEYGAAFADLATSGLPFPQWIRELTARRQAMPADEWLTQAADGAHRLLATGTTSVADVVTTGPGVQAAAAAGLGGVSYVEAVAADDERWPALRQRLEELLDQAPPDRQVGISPHTLYTLGTAVFRDVLTLARERGLRIHTHLAETVEESEYVLAGSGPYADVARRIPLSFELVLTGGAGVSPTAHLAELGGLGADVHVAHGVHVDAVDRARLRDTGTAVALCPRSNAVLAAGAPPVAAYLAEEVPFGIGTDSLASCPDLDLLADVRVLRRLARDQGYGGADLDARLIHAATAGGAGALGSTDIGELRPGARADLAVFTTDARMEPYAALLDSGVWQATVLAGVPTAGPDRDAAG